MFGPNIEFIECQFLYNILNEGIEYAKIGDPFYLYLLDCRTQKEYNESHIICAKHIKMNNSNYQLPYEAELQSRNILVVYDGNTSNLNNQSKAIECAKFLSNNGSKYSVKILKGGYETFSRLYPFLRTQKIIYMPKELNELKTYPSEILPNLYLGNKKHGTEHYIKKDLKLNSYVDCTTSGFKFKNENSIDYLAIPIEDNANASIEAYLEQACNFIDLNVNVRKKPCLIYSDLGISRSAAVCIAYLVFSEKLSFLDAFNKISKHKKIQPQQTFIEEIQQKFLKS